MADNDEEDLYTDNSNRTKRNMENTPENVQEQLRYFQEENRKLTLTVQDMNSLLLKAVEADNKLKETLAKRKLTVDELREKIVGLEKELEKEKADKEKLDEERNKQGVAGIILRPYNDEYVESGDGSDEIEINSISAQQFHDLQVRNSELEKDIKDKSAQVIKLDSIIREIRTENQKLKDKLTEVEATKNALSENLAKAAHGDDRFTFEISRLNDEVERQKVAKEKTESALSRTNAELNELKASLVSSPSSNIPFVIICLNTYCSIEML